MFKVWDIIIYNDSDFIYKIDTINSSGFHATTVHQVKRCIIAIFGHDKIRHATPEEIAAGHRIDCEILDHPEDYTSPNCKKFNERVK